MSTIALTDLPGVLFRFFTRPRILRPVFALLRRFAPVLVIGKQTIVSRYLDIVEILARDADFTIAKLNGPNIDRHDGPFVLGLDRGEQYQRESDMLHSVVRSEDLETIATIVRDEANRRIAIAWTQRRIDLVDGYGRAVAMRVVAAYFGVPETPKRELAGWLRDIFWDIFANVTGDRAVRARSARSSELLRAHLDRVIADRQATKHATPIDDVLGRMLALQDETRPWLDDVAIRRNLTGIITGTVDNTSLFLAHAFGELMRRPHEFALARRAALAGDRETVRRFVYEAARFDPAAPLLARYVPRETTIAAGTPRARTIAAGTTLLIGNISALFNPDGFSDPEAFDIEHDAGILHFGYGLHRCLGYRINGVVLGELATMLLGLSDLRLPRATSGARLADGPFPKRMLLDFA